MVTSSLSILPDIGRGIIFEKSCKVDAYSSASHRHWSYTKITVESDNADEVPASEEMMYPFWPLFLIVGLQLVKLSGRFDVL